MLTPGQSTILGALVSGPVESNELVWTASAGTLTGNGANVAYIAPDEFGEFTISVSLAGDSSVTATATVIVLENIVVGDDVRFRLTWGETPEDLDAHLWTPIDFSYHIYYGYSGNQDTDPYATLDRDDTDGFGPETITLFQRYAAGTYEYAVYNYTGTGTFAEAGAQVEFYNAQGRIATIPAPEGTGLWWHVFSIDGATGRVTEVNELLDSFNPYADATNTLASQQLVLEMKKKEQ